MRHIFLGFTALCLCSTSFVPAVAQDASRMDQVIRVTADAGDQFSGSALVARDGEILLDRGYGLANREWDMPNDGDTKFRIASLTKQFTSTAIMLLQERGKIDINAPIKTYLADTPPAWDNITVAHLLTHSSGIPDFTAFDDYERRRAQPATLEELIGRFRDRPLRFQPGEQWAYSNSGYVLLTAIIEKASGQPYASFVEENIFRPLGMTNSGYDTRGAILSHRASGYTPEAKGVVNADYIDMSVPQGAGGLYSTTRDLLKWEQGLYGGRILGKESLRVLTTPFKNNYALGLFVTQADGSTTYSHTGGVEGFNTYMAYDPDQRISVVVLGNLNGPATGKIGDWLLSLARGKAVTLPLERKAIALPAGQLRAYEGVYELSPSFALTVSVSKGKLMMQATGQQAFELFAESRDNFFLRVVDAQVRFERNDAGAIDGLILHQGGRDMTATRK